MSEIIEQQQIEVSPKESAKPEVITAEYLKSNTRIQGWLSFFLITMTIGGLFSAIYPIATFNVAEYAHSYSLGLVDIIVGIMMLLIAIYTIYAFTQRKPDAVFFAKTYVASTFIINLLGLVIHQLTGTEIEDIRGAHGEIKALILSAIWFIYLCLSEQVREVIPEEYRRTNKFHYILIAVLILLPSAMMTIGFTSLLRDTETKNKKIANALANIVLQENERTDGKVVFTVPEGYSCEESVEAGIKVFLMTSEEENINIIVCSDFDNDASLSNFKSYIKDSSPDINGLRKVDETNEQKRTAGPHSYFYKEIQYRQSFPFATIYWHYALVFDQTTGKVCVVSCYDSGDDSYISNFIAGIKFLK